MTAGRSGSGPWWRDERLQKVTMVALAAATAAIVVLAFKSHADARVDPGDDLSPAAVAPQTPTAGTTDPSATTDLTVVVVIGDSFTAGSGMNEKPTWLEQLQADHPDWLVKDGSVDGTGYVNPGKTTTFLDRIGTTLAPYQADLLIVAGGRSDDEYPTDEVTSAAARFLATVRDMSPSTDVLMLSPWASGDPPAKLLDMAAALKKVADQYSAKYFDVTHLLPPADIGSDGVHPTDAGQSAMLRAIKGKLASLGLPRADAYSAS